MRKMKDSWIPWIGEIPEGWETCAIRFFIKERIGGSWGNDEKHDSNDRICVRVADFDYSKLQIKFCEESDFTIRNYSDSEIFNKTLRYGDFLIEKSGGGEKTPVGRTVVYRLPYKALFANFMECFRFNENIDREFAKYAFFTNYNIGVTKHYFSQTTGIQNLNVSRYFREVKIPSPPLPEQRQIADFLDARCAEIDALCADIQAEIDTLEEYKRSVITETVTKGLDPNAPMKDSGIPWIGEIPKGWKVGRIKDIIALLTDFTSNGSFADLAKNVTYLSNEGYARLVRLTDLRENLLNSDGVYVSESSYKYLAKSKLYGGEVLVANVGAYSGLFCVMPYDQGICTLGPNMFLLRTSKRMASKYLYFLGQTKQVWEQLRQKAISTAQPKLNKSDVKNVFICIPPLSTQREICSFLDRKSSEIESIIDINRKKISILSDYKKSLIYEYVTGKKEVPHE